VNDGAFFKIGSYTQPQTTKPDPLRLLLATRRTAGALHPGCLSARRSPAPNTKRISLLGLLCLRLSPDLFNPRPDSRYGESERSKLASFFIIGRWADMLDMLSFDGTKLSEILSSRCQRQTVIRTASYFISVVLVLPVVVPETDLANLIFAAAMQCDKSTARAAVTLLCFRCVIDVLERHHLFLANVKDEPRAGVRATDLLNHSHVSSAVGD
jgi:hypothetical protein